MYLIVVLVQEFEEHLVDDEDPEEVERELIGAQDYYEKDHDEKKPEEKSEEPKEKEESHEDHEGHEHGEGEHEDAEPETIRDPSERLKAFMEWLFGKIEVLETENTRQYEQPLNIYTNWFVF